MILGKSFKIGYVDDSGKFTPLAFAQSASIDKKTSFSDVSSPKTGPWVHRRPKRNSWAMQHEGLLGDNTLTYTYKGQSYNFYDLMDLMWSTKQVFTARWVEDGDSGTIQQGQCFIEDMKQVASEKALTKISIKLSGTGELKNLSKEQLTGSFAYCISGSSLTLYTIDWPLASFSVHADDSGIGTWDVTAHRIQVFYRGSLRADSVITAWRGTGASAVQQTGVTFTNCSTLHFVFLQTDERDDMQQLHRYVTPLWWGGLAIRDISLKRGVNVVATFATAGLTGSAPRVEIDNTIDITNNSYRWEITSTSPQTIHCIDRTTSLTRTVKVSQAQNNTGEGGQYLIVAGIEPTNFASPFTVWGNNNNGTALFTWQSTSLLPIFTSNTLIPDAQHLHCQLEGLAADDGGPWDVQRELITDTALHEVYYAYDATAQRLRIYCPTQELSAQLDDGNGNVIYEGMMFDTDSNGGRIPVTVNNVSSATGIMATWGNYHFNDVTVLQVMNLSNTYTVSVLPLDDVILTNNGTEVGRIPALSDPNGTYTVPGYIVNGAEMASGAAQTVTYAPYFQAVCIKTAVTQTGSSQWSLSIQLLGNSDGSGGAATLPGNLYVTFPGYAHITVPAGQSSLTQTITYNPAWTTPTAELSHPKAADFRLNTAPAPDVTLDHWTAYKLGYVTDAYYYDIAYLGTANHSAGIAVSSPNIFGQSQTAIVVGGESVANALYRVTSSSEDSVSFSVAAVGAPAWSAVDVEHVSVNTTDKLVLSYRLRDISGGTTVTDLTNIKSIVDSVPTYSRHSCISDILPRVGVVWRSTTETYAQKSLSGLRPGNREAFEVTALSGTVYDDSAVDYQAKFTDNNNNTISVGSGLTGVQVLAVNHSAPLSFI